MPTALIVGATRGLGAALAKTYASKGYQVLATGRSSSAPSPLPSDPKLTHWIPSIDVASPSAGASLASACKSSSSSSSPQGPPIDTAIINAGYMSLESFDEPDWDAEIKMYTVCAVGPVFLVHHLVKEGCLAKGGKVVLISSEGGSIGLRHESEGGGMYGHHASKAALNMVGKCLSFDLKDKGIAVGMVHPGFMRTEMTKGVGFDKFWDDGGAVPPETAAEELVKFIDTFDIEKTGTFWAPMGPKGIGTVEQTMGKDLPTPLELIW